MSEALNPIGMAIEFGGGLMGGIEANRAARAQARVDEENARRTVLQGEHDAQQTRRDEALASAAMLVAGGGNGLMLEGGSLAGLIAQNALQREYEILNIRTLAVDQANELHGRAAESRSAGRAALVQSAFGAIGGAVKDVSAMRDQRRIDAQLRHERQQQLGGGTSLVPRRAPPMRVTGPPL